MAGSARNFSSWRQDFITCEPGVTDFPFFDTKPNLIYIKNPNNTFINIGMKSVPTEKEYEFQIIANSYDAFGQPNGCGHLYIYNPSASNVIIECYSQYDEFSILILKNYSLALNKLSVEGEMTFKEGAQLPAGNHEIGAVRLNNQQLKTLTDIMETISTNTDKNEDVYVLLANQLNGALDGSLKNILTDIADYFIALLQNSPNAGNVNLYNIHYQIKTLAENLLSNAAITDKITLYDVITNLDKIYNKNNDFYNQFMSQISLSEPGNIKALLGDIITAVNNVHGGDGAWTADDIANIVSPILTDKSLEDSAVYLNNVTTFSYTNDTENTQKIKFFWLCYDGGTTANVNVGTETVLTLLSKERFLDIVLAIPAGTTITISSTEPMYRIKYGVM